MHWDRQPREGLSGAVRHSRFQSDLAQGSGPSGDPCHTGRCAAATAYAGRDASRYRAPTFSQRANQSIEKARVQRLKDAPATRTNAMVNLIARVFGIGIETADLLVHEILSRNLRDRRAVARYAGLTGSPDESGDRRREKGLARVGNARVRRGMVQLAWRFLGFHPDSALTQWYNKRAADGRGSTRKTMIVALARKLLIVLWRMVTTGEVPADLKLRRTTA